MEQVCVVYGGVVYGDSRFVVYGDSIIVSAYKLGNGTWRSQNGSIFKLKAAARLFQAGI